jgi:hypothetical protein
MQAFAYYHVIPAAKWYISPGGGFYVSAFRWKDNSDISVERGKSHKLEIKVVSPLPKKQNITLDTVEAIDPPQGVTVGKPEFSNGVLSFEYQVAKDAKPQVINQLFVLRAVFDQAPNRQGVVKRGKGAVTLPVRRVIIK